jgi:hypothetical protein
MSPKDKKELEQGQVELLKIRDTYNEWITEATADLLRWVNERWPQMTLNEAHHLFSMAGDSVLYRIYQIGSEGKQTAFKDSLEGYA